MEGLGYIVHRAREGAEEVVMEASVVVEARLHIANRPQVLF